MSDNLLSYCPHFKGVYTDMILCINIMTVTVISSINIYCWTMTGFIVGVLVPLCTLLSHSVRSIRLTRRAKIRPAICGQCLSSNVYSHKCYDRLTVFPTPLLIKSSYSRSHLLSSYVTVICHSSFVILIKFHSVPCCPIIQQICRATFKRSIENYRLLLHIS